jgi:hypothetical protein
MSTLSLKLALAAILALPSGAATSGEVARGFFDTGFIARAWQVHDWIVAHTDYEPLERLPTFLFVSSGELNYLALNDTEAGYSGETRSIEGVYASSIVFLSDGFQIGRDDDVLLHELVHHFQEMSGSPLECVGAREPEAYRLQGEFVNETGIGTAPDPAFILFVSSC